MLKNMLNILNSVKIDSDLKKALNRVLEDGYTAILVKDDEEDENKFYNWFFYLIEGVGAGYIEKNSFNNAINISSEYIATKENGSGARVQENINPKHIPNRILKNAVTFAFSKNVEFIKDLKTLFVQKDFFFPFVRILKKDKVYTPYELLEELNGVYIVKHGPNYKAQLYLKKPKSIDLEDKAVAVRIENDEFIEVRGTPQEQINLLKEVFPYVKEEELDRKLIAF